MELNGHSLESMAKRLADEHRAEDAQRQVFLVPDPLGKEIRLIEVTEQTPPSGELWVFRFRATSDVPYPIAIGQVTPDEWTQVQRGMILPPAGWLIPQAKAI